MKSSSVSLCVMKTRNLAQRRFAAAIAEHHGGDIHGGRGDKSEGRTSMGVTSQEVVTFSQGEGNILTGDWGVTRRGLKCELTSHQA